VALGQDVLDDACCGWIDVGLISKGWEGGAGVVCLSISGCSQSQGSALVVACSAGLLCRAGLFGDDVVAELVEGAVLHDVRELVDIEQRWHVDVAVSRSGSGWNDGEACLANFGQEAVGELDGGEEGVGNGALDAAFAESLEDGVESGEGRGFVDHGREDERFHFSGGFLCWFGWELRVVVTAVFGGFGCRGAAALTIFEVLKAAT